MYVDPAIRLDEIARSAPHTTGVMVTATRYCFSIFRQHLRGPRVLEFGPAEGVMTDLLVAEGYSVTAVEGSSEAARALQSRLPEVSVVRSLFEDYEADGPFDSIVLGHVLEHVSEPGELLRRLRNWLEPNHGVVLASVPNAHSLHRQAAVEMGLLGSVNDLNESDLSHGHMRVFSFQEIADLFSQNGLAVQKHGGYWLKTLSNAQIEAWYSADIINAYMALGELYPGIAAETYVVARVT